MRRSLVATTAALSVTVCLALLVSCAGSSTIDMMVSQSDYRSSDANLKQSLGLDTPIQVQIARRINPFSNSTPRTYSPPSATPYSSATSVAATSTAATPSVANEAIPRMIVRNGKLTMVVDNIGAAMADITQLINATGGYVVTADKTGTGKSISGTIAVRVPEASFDTVMQSIRDLAVSVTGDTTTAQDVSEEFSDLGAKLKNLTAAEAQLTEIMEKAVKVEDILAIQKQMATTREDIERTAGRMQFLQQTSDTSLITVRLQQATVDVQIVAGTTYARTEDTIGFAAQITGGVGPFSYIWLFGDGKASVEVKPFHRYASSGDYTVSLTVRDDRGNTATDTRERYIYVMPGWSPGDVAKGAWRGVVSFGRFVFALGVWLLVFSPAWLLLGGLGKWAWRNHRRKKAVRLAVQAGGGTTLQ